MNRTRTSCLALLVFATAFWAACDDGAQTGPVDLEPDRPPPGAIVDDANGADRRGLYFLSPLAPDPESSGTFEGSLLPFATVQVCAWEASACAAEVAHFTHAGEGGTRLRIDGAGGEHYRVDWALGEYELDGAAVYRIRILVGPFELGHADLRVRESDGAAPPQGPYLTLDADSVLPIRFRLEAEPIWAELPPLQPIAESAPAGSSLDLAGPEETITASTDLELYVHGEPAPVTWTGPGKVSMGVPLFLDEATTWPAPPEEALDLLLFEGGEPVARARDALRVLPLQEAAGSSVRMEEALGSLSRSVSRIGVVLPGGAGVEAQWLRAMTGALDSLVHGTGEGTLSDALGELEADAAQLRLMEAWLASSGVLAALEQQVAWLEAVATGLEDGAAGGPARPESLAPGAAPRAHATKMDAGPASGAAPRPAAAGATIVTDVSLARRMQLYEVTKLFGDVVVNGTATKFAETVGLAAGAIGIVKSIRAVAVANAVLAVSNFVLNKVIVGLMPAKIDRFDLTLTRVNLEPGEITDARVEITASNDPPPIGVQDLVGLILANLGAGKTPDAQVFRDYLLNTANFYLGTAQSMLASYASAHPELNLDVDVAGMPNMQWEATITDPRLVERRSWTPEVIDSLAGQVNWQASEEQMGEGRIYARTATGPEAVLISLPLGIEYHGAAFGDDILDTAVDTVRVASDLVVLVDFPPTIDPDGFNVLEVRAGYPNSAGDTLWWEGLQVDLAYDGGTVEQESGATDADGQFIALARVDPESDRIVITATVTGLLGETVDRTVEATVCLARDDDDGGSGGGGVTALAGGATGCPELSVSPASVTLHPGDTLAFTATVAGVSDASVTWAATGGSIGPDGLYTAPNQPGGYTVTATSVEDPLLSAEASIIVEPEPVMMVRPVTNYSYVGATDSGHNGATQYVSEEVRFAAYDIGVASGASSASQSARFEYDPETGSLASIQIGGSVVDNATSRFELHFMVSGKATGIRIAGSCALEFTEDLPFFPGLTHWLDTSPSGGETYFYVRRAYFTEAACSGELAGRSYELPEGAYRLYFDLGGIYLGEGSIEVDVTFTEADAGG